MLKKVLDYLNERINYCLSKLFELQKRDLFQIGVNCMISILKTILKLNVILCGDGDGASGGDGNGGGGSGEGDGAIGGVGVEGSRGGGGGDGGGGGGDVVCDDEGGSHDEDADIGELLKRIIEVIAIVGMCDLISLLNIVFLAKNQILQV